jgi:hypothetical protein
MKKTLRNALCALLFAPMLALAQGTLNAYQTVDLPVSPKQVWDAIKDFDGLARWHPVFSADVLTGGQNNVPGATRRLTVKDGPSFDEELLSFDDAAMSLTYRIIGQNELPIENYTSTLSVVSIGNKRSAVIWRGAYTAKPGNKDGEMIQFIEGVYRAGLDNLKTIVK